MGLGLLTAEVSLVHVPMQGVPVQSLTGEERSHLPLSKKKKASQVPLVVKNLPVNAGDARDAGWSPGEGDGNPPYSCLENPMDREACRVTGHGVAKSRTRQQWGTQNIKQSVLQSTQ